MSEDLKEGSSLGPSRGQVPATVADLIAQRRSGVARTLNDDIEDLHLREWPNQEYRKLFEAVYAPDYITGDRLLEDGEAARMLKQRAIEDGGYPRVANGKLKVLILALRVVMNRYHLGRLERARMIGGVQIDTSRPVVNPQHH
jgi:hypothetical protein